MDDKKISELTALTTPSLEDLLAIVDDPSGTPETKKITLLNLLKVFTEWADPQETWIYASATTITVPSGAASRYQIGDKFKLTANAVVLYGVIVGVADTLLTVAGNTLTNHTFTANYYSRAANPFGFPSKFDYTAELFGSSGSRGAYDQQFGMDGGSYITQGRLCTVWASARLSNLGSWANSVYMNLPISPIGTITTGGPAGGVVLVDGGLNTLKAVSANVSTSSGGILQWNKQYGAQELAWSDLAINDWFTVNLTYPF